MNNVQMLPKRWHEDFSILKNPVFMRVFSVFGIIPTRGIDALTGATVTSKAIVRAVNSAVAYVTGADTVSAATSWGG